MRTLLSKMWKIKGVRTILMDLLDAMGDSQNAREFVKTKTRARSLHPGTGGPEAAM